MKFNRLRKAVTAVTVSLLFAFGAAGAHAAVTDTSQTAGGSVTHDLSEYPTNPRAFISGSFPDYSQGTPGQTFFTNLPHWDDYWHIVNRSGKSIFYGYDPKPTYAKEYAWRHVARAGQHIGIFTDECGGDHFINADFLLVNDTGHGNAAVGVWANDEHLSFELTGNGGDLSQIDVHLWSEDGYPLPSQIYMGFSDLDEGETVILGDGITSSYLRQDAEITHHGSTFTGTSNNSNEDPSSDAYQKHYLGVTVSPDFSFSYGNKDYTELENGGLTFAPFIRSTSDYYPLMAGQPLTVSYDANGGEGNSPEAENVKHERHVYGFTIEGEPQAYDDTQVDLKRNPDITRKGYRFNGWSMKPDGSCPLTNYSVHNIHHSMTVYARWEKLPPTSTISFDPNGGLWTIDPYTGVVGSTFDLSKLRNRFSKPGYSFTEWMGSDGKKYGYLDTITVPAYDLTLKPIWKGVFVTFDENWGDGVSRTSQQESADGGYVKIKKAGSRPGYRFLGWNTKADGSGQKLSSFTNQIRVFKDATYFAQWVKTYQVKLDPNGGVGEPSVREYAADGTAFPDASFTRDGYKFVGWNTAADGSGQDIIWMRVTQDVTLYAQWKKSVPMVDLTPAHPTSHTLLFDTEGGAPVDPVRADYGQKVTLPVPSRPGFQFMGWFTIPDGKGERLSELRLTTDTTVYASWKKAIPITDLTPAHKTERNSLFRSNDPQDVVITVHAVDGDSISTQVGLTRQGYRLVGWADHEGSAVVSVPVDSRLMVDGDRTLYAVWEQNTALDKPSSKKPVTPSHPRVVSEASSPVGELASTGSGVEPLLIAAGVLIALALLDLAWMKWGVRRARAKNGGMRGDNGDYL